MKKKAAKRGLHHRSSQNKPAAGWRSTGSGVSGAVRALTGDELRQKKIQSGAAAARTESNSRHFQDGAL